NGGRTDVTVWGDLLTETARRRGVAGTVIHGACRDSKRIRDSGYPLLSRATYMRTGKDRVRAVDRQVPISVGAAAVEPDDLIVADADGVVVIPAARADDVLEVALEVDAAEDRIRSAVRSGASLADARRRFGYHDLQTGRPESG
ncbi:MAG: RraA family protein, partial [Gemmatimonadota bacterium]